jgi:hypothetical protein
VIFAAHVSVLSFRVQYDPDSNRGVTAATGRSLEMIARHQSRTISSHDG